MYRASVGKPLLSPDDPHIVAIASDVALPDATVPVVHLDDIEAIVDLIVRQAAPLAAAGANGR